MRKEGRTVRAGNISSSPCLQMSRAITMTVGLMLWGATAWGATLTWTANNEPDLAGYRVYQCSQQPCGQAFGSATLLTTLGTVTSFNIGTPAVVQYYVITAYDFANNESSESGVATFTPTATPPPPPQSPPPTPPPSTPPPSPPPSTPPPATVTLAVLGSPNLGEPWTVQATTDASGAVSVEVRINGALDHTERQNPYCAFGESNGSCARIQRPSGTYTVEFRVLSSGTEVARQSVVVTAAAAPGSPPPAPPPAPSNLHLSSVQ